MLCLGRQAPARPDPSTARFVRAARRGHESRPSCWSPTHCARRHQAEDRPVSVFPTQYPWGLSPLEFMQLLAALVPRPRLHLIRFHGVLAPNAKLRPIVVPQVPPAQARPAIEAAAAAVRELEPVQAGAHRISWARLLKRVFDIDMQHCPTCGGGEFKIIAAILERPVVEKILTHQGLDPQPPPSGRAREPGIDFTA